jgi:hypothetical protein
MPWPTTQGLRILRGAEAELVAGAIGMMVDTHVAELRDHAEPWSYGVEWFDQWEPAQRLWLLEQVTTSMLGRNVIDSPAAMFDATADAIFMEVIDLIQIETEQGSATEAQLFTEGQRSWREDVLRAWQQQTKRPIEVSDSQTDLGVWQRLITQIADQILGVRVYQRAEAFRDGDITITAAFLRDRGLPEDYLSRIPPLPTVDETQRSIDRIQAYVFDSGQS